MLKNTLIWLFVGLSLGNQNIQTSNHMEKPQQTQVQGNQEPKQQLSQQQWRIKIYEHFVSLFNEYDKNKNGVLTQEQLFSHFAKQYESQQQLYQQSVKNVKPMFEKADPDGDGLTSDQFIQMAIKTKQKLNNQQQQQQKINIISSQQYKQMLQTSDQNKLPNEQEKKQEQL